MERHYRSIRISLTGRMGHYLSEHAALNGGLATSWYNARFASGVLYGLALALEVVRDCERALDSEGESDVEED